jgi:hypothetical protein
VQDLCEPVLTVIEKTSINRASIGNDYHLLLPKR